MKKLYFIGGTMGVGKTTTCKLLKKSLNNCVFLDGDWCWDMNPFNVNEETRSMVMKNICYLLNSFLECSTYDNIIFCWVLHKQSIINDILNNINISNCEVKNISLICDENSLVKRLQKDIDNGIRNKDIITDSLSRIPLYNELDTIKIDTSNLNPLEVLDEIIKI